MSNAQDVMDRLAAVDPVAEPDRLDIDHQREADALLERILATPAAPARRRPRRRWPRLAVATALGAAVLFAALSLLDSDEGRAPGVLAKAVAALSQKDAVYHAVFIGHMRTSDMPERRPVPYEETWHTAGGRMRWKSYMTHDGEKGRLLSELAGRRRPGRLGGPALMYDARRNTIFPSGFGRTQSKTAPGVDPFDPGRSLREFQAEGRLRVAGEVELRGRRAYRLVSDWEQVAGGATARSEIVVDARTYLPIEQRLFSHAPNGKTARVVWRYLTYERLPLNERTSRLLDLH
ncbi:MAG TPA: hypothetical protein VJT68_08945, partial [Thermoleophilaceae bacterium]|nr:hypothetical protein [Thermoleophilaceae bacterium]